MEVKDFFVGEDEKILDAMEHLGELALKVLFIEHGGRLAASLTDGDIRRWILNGGDLKEPVKNVANYEPKYLVHATREAALAFLKEKSIEAVPIVDEKLRVIDIVFWNETAIPVWKNTLKTPVVIMAGGQGTRLYPYTKILPKPLIPVGELPIAEIIINRFREYGCEEFHLVLNHKKNMIKAYFNEIEKDYKINYVDEPLPLGTGGGVRLLKGRLNETFILTNCDILINEDMSKIYEFHKEKKNLVTMICSLKTFKLPYGVVNIEEGGGLLSFSEKPEYSFFTNTGCYIVEPEVMDEIEEGVAVGFPEIIEKLKNGGKNVGIYPISENAWLDMGEIDELEKMKSRLE